jgi:hypothetical protein
MPLSKNSSCYPYGYAYNGKNGEGNRDQETEKKRQQPREPTQSQDL